MAARRFGEPDYSRVAFEWNAGADFSSVSSDFKALGAFFCPLVHFPRCESFRETFKWNDYLVISTAYDGF
jgi:hypothetical protein